ncbi:hypothetical protein E1189_11300 [Sansalvadorimonas verongulae]|nr:hypothetical protein [Sansalvadorimonas verongulae]
MYRLSAIIILLIIAGTGYGKTYRDDHTSSETPREGLIRLKRVVIFGDSLADTGNTWQVTRYLNGIGEKPWFYDDLFAQGWEWLPISQVLGVTPPSGYYDGRFSNGPLAGELLAEMMGMSANNPSEVENLAFGGSWTMSARHFMNSWMFLTGDSSVSLYDCLRHLVSGQAKWLIPSASEIVDWYLTRHRTLDDETMYVMASGANDYQNRYWDVESVVAEQVVMIRRLIEAGARHISWGTLPDLTFTPCFQGSEDVKLVDNLIKQHNQKVIEARKQLVQEYPYVKMVFVDGYSAVRLFFHHAESFGFKVLDKGCTDVNFPGCPLKGGVSIQQGESMSVCSNPDEYFFWDTVHPSARVYEHIATYLCVMTGLEGYWTNCRLPRDFNLGRVAKLYDLIVQEKALDSIPTPEELGRLLQLDTLSGSQSL